jgi:hypothetical protein
MDTADPTDRPRRLPARPLPLIAVLVAALAVIAAVVLTGHGRHHGPAGAAGPGTAGRPAHPADFHTGGADLLVLDGVSGRIRVTADADAGGVSGTFARGDGAPARVTARTSLGSGGRTVTVVCADGAGTEAPCAGDLTVTVPGRTGLRLRQTSGETTLAGLGGRLDVTVASDRLAASGLRPRQADFAVTSGSADVGFTDAPDRLGVNAASASVALRVPPAGGYAVTSAATSADVRVEVPRHDGGPHAIALRVVSGSLAVLPA